MQVATTFFKSKEPLSSEPQAMPEVWREMRKEVALDDLQEASIGSGLLAVQGLVFATRI